MILLLKKAIIKRLQLIKYNNSHEIDWDKFVVSSTNASFIHLRKYINYHKDRFIDESLMIYNDNDLVAIFPCTHDIKTNSIISHPGLPYCGLIYKNIDFFQIDMIINQIVNFFRSLGIIRIVYKLIPFNFCKSSNFEDEYVLYKNEFKLSRVDLNSVINLGHIHQKSKRRERSFQKSLKYNLTISNDLKNIDEFWNILSENLKVKFNTIPVHTIGEIKKLLNLFPKEILPFFVINDGLLVSGAICYSINNCFHIQYISSNKTGIDTCANDFLLTNIINSCLDKNYRYFSFGISSYEDGQKINTSLLKFKSEFGSRIFLNKFYTRNL